MTNTNETAAVATEPIFSEEIHEAAASLSVIEREIFVGQHIEFIREEEPFLTEMVNVENAVQTIAEDIYKFKTFATAVDYHMSFMHEFEDAKNK